MVSFAKTMSFASYAKPARELINQNTRAVLSTISDQWFPYASMVDYAPFEDGDLLLLLSHLAEHTRYLSVNPKCSLLVAPNLYDTDGFSKARVTVVGEVELLTRSDELAQLFLKYHPRASAYMVMNDFRFFRFAPESARYIGGFGRMAWIEQDEYRAALG